MTEPRPSTPPSEQRGASAKVVGKDRLSTRVARALAIVVLAAAGVSVFPSLYCARAARPVLAAEPPVAMRFVRGAAFQGEQHSEADLDLFATGSERADGEWTLSTYAFTAMAAGQTFVRSPETYDEIVTIERRAVERAIAPSSHQFDTQGWRGDDALYSLGDDRRGHAAYLAYLGMALGWDRVVQPEGVWTDLHDGVVAALERRLTAAPTGVFASYPDEYYPADAAVAALAVDLHARALGRSAAALDVWEQRFREHCVDPRTGLLWQSIGASGKTADSRARASGTAMVAWLMAGPRPALSRDLYQALRRERYREVLGFAGIREHAGDDDGPGDQDTGPLLFGLSPSATAFALGAARAQHDSRTFTRLYASAHFFGAPVDGDQRRNFVVGGPLGDALLAATVTALDADEYARIGKGGAGQ